jgi:hypothetical protein
LFKKGIKISGTALKEVVGNVKPSFIQRYSDDETSPPVAAAAKPSRQQFVQQELFSPADLQPKPTTAVAGRRKMKGAREIGPDEDWDVKSSSKNNIKTVKPSPLVLTSTKQVEEVEEEQVEVNQLVEEEEEQVEENMLIPQEEQETVLLDPTNSLMFSNDMLMSFDFKFEGEDDSATPPMELFKEMFSSTEKKRLPSTSVPSAEIDESSILMILPPPGGLTAPIYPSPFLLEVRRLMRISENGISEIPHELKSLSRSMPTAAPQTKVVYSDNNWRTVKPKTITPGAADPQDPSFAVGTWRASGYGQRWNGNKSNTKTTTPPSEEGFW